MHRRDALSREPTAGHSIDLPLSALPLRSTAAAPLGAGRESIVSGRKTLANKRQFAQSIEALRCGPVPHKQRTVPPQRCAESPQRSLEPRRRRVRRRAVETAYKLPLRTNCLRDAQSTPPRYRAQHWTTARFLAATDASSRRHHFSAPKRRGQAAQVSRWAVPVAEQVPACSACALSKRQSARAHVPGSSHKKLQLNKPPPALAKTPHLW